MTCPTCGKPCAARREGLKIVPWCEGCELGVPIAQGRQEFAALPRAPRSPHGTARRSRKRLYARTARLYKSGLTLAQVSAKMGVPQSTVRNWLDKASARREKSGRRPQPYSGPPRAELMRLYAELGSMGRVAVVIGRSASWTYRTFQTLKIPTNAHGGWRAGGAASERPSHEFTLALYREKGSVSAVARSLRVHRHTATAWLTEAGAEVGRQWSKAA